MVWELYLCSGQPLLFLPSTTFAKYFDFGIFLGRSGLVFFAFGDLSRKAETIYVCIWALLLSLLLVFCFLRDISFACIVLFFMYMGGDAFSPPAPWRLWVCFA